MVRKKIHFIILTLVLPLPVLAASIGVVVPESFYPSGSLLVAKVLINSSDQDINAASAQIKFPPGELSVVSIQTEQSIFNVWPQKPSFSNELGTISMEGVMIGDSWIGEGGEMAEIIFKVKAAGNAKINITSSSVLANDGEGTNILDYIRHAAVALGLSDSTKYLVVKAEEVTPSESQSQVADNQSVQIKEEMEVAGRSFWKDQVNVAYAIFLVLLLIALSLWRIARGRKTFKKSTPSETMHKNLVNVVKTLEEKSKKETLTPEEEKILADFRGCIIEEYEELIDKN